MRAAHEPGRQLERDAIRALYVRSVLAAARYADRMARATLDRPPRHVLLLHENDLAGLFVADLVRALRADGWSIVTADDAFSDPIAAALPDTLHLGEGRVAALMYARHREARFTEPPPSLPELEAEFAAHALQ
jgi:hypothetical protein